LNLTYETKTLEISEKDSLVLWRALQMYKNAIISNNSTACESDYERATMLLAKSIYMACDFGGSLEDGETVRSIYEDMI
jgi:hypothetical protein